MERTLTPYTKISSKWIKILNVRSETIKLLEENTGSELFSINLSNILGGYVYSGKGSKAKINKWDYSKPKRVCTVKETIDKMKRQPAAFCK